MRHPPRLLIAVLPLLILSSSVFAKGRAGASAADFPPGSFSDGGHYQLDDFEGKLLVLFFYEKDCPTCRGTIPARNEVVAKYRDKPVKFVAIAAGDTASEASSYIRSTKLAMPVFADALGIMEKRYGFEISMQNIYQTRIIGPDGSVVGSGMDAASIDRALAQVKWKYKDGGYDAALAPAVEAFEWGQFEAGMRLLRPQLKSPNKPLAESAQKLMEAVKAEGARWKAEADSAAAQKPAEAFDIYTRIAAAFTGDELAKSVEEPLKKLRTNKAVTDELAARRQYAQLQDAASRAKPTQKAEVAGFCQGLVKQYPNTPTGEKVAAYLKELGE